MRGGSRRWDWQARGRRCTQAPPRGATLAAEPGGGGRGGQTAGRSGSDKRHRTQPAGMRVMKASGRFPSSCVWEGSSPERLGAGTQLRACSANSGAGEGVAVPGGRGGGGGRCWASPPSPLSTVKPHPTAWPPEHFQVHWPRSWVTRDCGRALRPHVNTDPGRRTGYAHPRREPQARSGRRQLTRVFITRVSLNPLKCIRLYPCKLNSNQDTCPSSNPARPRQDGSLTAGPAPRHSRRPPCVPLCCPHSHTPAP